MLCGLSLSGARRAAITAAVCGTSLIGAAGAQAAGSSIALTNDTATPEQAVPVDLTVSGTNASTTTGHIEAVERPGGGLACQSSYNEDVSTLGGQDRTIVGPGADPVTPGNYSVAINFKPDAPGAYQVCAWLDGATDGSQPLAGPAPLSFTARGPQVTQFTVSVPKSIAPKSAFAVSYTTQVDQPLSLLSVITTASSCAQSYELQRAQDNGSAGILLGQGTTIYGGPATTQATVKPPQGTYLVCSWIEGPNPDPNQGFSPPEVDATMSTPITVGTPVTKLPPTPALRLNRTSASLRSGIGLSGTTTQRFTGRLSVLAACGRATRRGSAAVAHGRFTAHLALPAGCSIGRRVKLTVAWAGSRAWSRQAASRTASVVS